MKVFISQPMNGLSDEEITSKRDKAIEEIKELFKDNNIEIVSTTYARDGEILPKEANRLWWLGRAIQMLDGADAIYICNGWEDSKGCRIEKCIADEYNIPIYYQKDILN